MKLDSREFRCDSPVLVLADRGGSEYGRVRLARQHQILFTLAELVLSVAAVVAKVLRVDLSDDERMTRASILHDVTLGGVELHRLLKPDDLRVETKTMEN